MRATYMRTSAKMPGAAKVHPTAATAHVHSTTTKVRASAVETAAAMKTATAAAAMKTAAAAAMKTAATAAASSRRGVGYAGKRGRHGNNGENFDVRIDVRHGTLGRPRQVSDESNAGGEITLYSMPKFQHRRATPAVRRNKWNID
jgi:hypothetical protein